MMQIFPVMDESQQQFLKDSSSSSGGTGGSFRGLPAINPTPNSSVPPTPSTSPAIKPHLHDTNGRPHKKSVIFYSKTIGQSARDQHHFLSAAELATRRFNYSSKIVLLTTLAIGRLVHDNFHFACLAITGLTKLAAKNNTEVHTHGKSMVRPDQTIGISTKLIHKRSNFMVALNSLSASSEEGLLRDIKIDLNSNLWTRLKSYMDVVGTIIVSNDSISKLQNSNSIAKLNPNRSTKELSTADMNRDRSLTHLPSQSAKNNSDSKITDQSQKLSNESKDGEAKNESKNTTDYSGEDEVKLPPLNIGNGNKPALTSKPSMSNLMRLQKSISFTSPPGSPMMNPNANTTHNHHQSKISVTQLKRVNSLKQTSEADFSKSKKIASNIVSQLLLDWLETRQDPLFSSDAIAALTELWKEHGKNSNMDRFNTESAKSKEESGSLLEKKEDSFRQYDEANNASLDLYVDINKCLLANLDRYVNLCIMCAVYIISDLLILSRFNLELLDSLVQMYVSVRSASRKWTEAAANDADGVMEGSSEADALEALVGLRFTIAMMHARKEHHALVRHRALLMDVVKVFLLKSAHSEIVLINNIAFTEDNYYQIENTLGPSLLCSLDVVFRTFRLLSDHQWSYSDHASAGKVGWRSDGDYFRVREDDDNCVRSFHSGDGSLVVEEGDVNGTNRSQSRAVKSVTSQSTEHASSDSDENPVDSK